MRFTIPSVRTEGQVQLPMRSSDGVSLYPVLVDGTAVGCPCKGSRNHGRCRHRKAAAVWLNSIYPPPRLPE